MNYEELLKQVRALPPMTEAQREEQLVSFAYGNLMATTNHGRGVTREQVRAIVRRTRWRRRLRRAWLAITRWFR